MRLVPLLILLSLIVANTRLAAQQCGCEGEGNCPYPINDNSTSTVSYEVKNAYINNLANPSQGVCGVRLRFRHGRIGDIEIRLRSPNGTVVQLVGSPTTPCKSAIFTPIATWDILFVRDSVNCAPDKGNLFEFPCRFTTCPPADNWGSANYTGKYTPYTGSLKDFNSGTVTGMWHLNIVDKASGNAGTIFDFQVIFCDQSGFNCCEADAGDLAAVKDVNACQGDSALLLKAVPKYGPVKPDSTKYAYTYPVFRNDTLIQYNKTADLRMMVAGNYTVCGLSYLQTDSLKLPRRDTVFSPKSFYTNLNGPNPLLCADIDTNCVNVRIAPIPLPTTRNESICDGDTLRIGTQAFTAGGNYTVRLQSAAGCDSIINLNLTVLPKVTYNATPIVLCTGEKYILGNDTITTSGMYSRTYKNANMCDSTVMYDITILQPIDTLIRDTICLGQSRTIGSNTYFSEGVYTDTLQSQVFPYCDSVVTLDLKLNIIGLAINSPFPDTLTCSHTTETLNATNSANYGIDSIRWSTLNGQFFGSTTAVTANVVSPGDYTVRVFSKGCSASRTRTVFQDITKPTAVIQNPGTLTCNVTSVQLNGITSFGQGAISFRWASISGGPVSDSISITSNVSLPGVYRLVVQNQGNGCRDTATVTVLENKTAPVANAGPDGMLSCSQPGVTLNASASAPSNRIDYSWSTSNGVIIGTTTNAQVLADAPGIYRLEITDRLNGCRDTDFVQVTVDTLTPVAIINASGNGNLTCSNSQVILDGRNSVKGSGVTVKWLGPIDSGQNTLLATATRPDQYALVLDDPINGCADTAFHTIVYDTLAPIANAGPDKEMNCTTQSVTIGAANSSFGSGYLITWSHNGQGLIQGRTDSTVAVVGQPGLYFLEVRNTSNGCSKRDTVLVADNFQPPISNAGPDRMLNCRDASVLLDGSASSAGFSTYEWRNSSGQIIGTNKTIDVNIPGTFTLTTTFAFCNTTDTVIVRQDILRPIVNAGSDTFLHCTTGVAILNGSGSNSGAEFINSWTTPNGIIVNGANSLSPTVSKTGTYILAVANSLNFCTASDTVLVYIDSIGCKPNVNAGADGLITCYNASFRDTLSATGPSGPAFNSRWTIITGNIIDTSNVFRPVTGVGEYVLTITNTLMGLSASDTVRVLSDTIFPIANAGPTNLSFGCDVLDSCYTLNASGSSTGPSFRYQWDSLNGSFCSGSNVQSPQVRGPGIYNLIVTNTLNGCTAGDAILIELTGVAPMASAGSSLQIPCGDTTAILNGSLSSQGANYTYQWISRGGTIVSNGNGLMPVIKTNNPRDTFALVVTNSINKCRDTSRVVVFAPIDCFPLCQVTSSGSISCNIDTVYLSSSGSSTGPDVSYLWKALNGSLDGNVSMAGNFTRVPGTYDLTVTRTYPNGARFSSNCQVQVADSRNFPIANAGPDVNINCATSSPVLNGSGSSSGGHFNYQWATSNGNILSGQNTSRATVNAPGDYFLRVRNTQNGCESLDTVKVGRDTLRPTAIAGPGGQLSCVATNFVLNGSATPANALFSWTSTDGNVCAGGTTASPVVCAAGTYKLTVTNPVNGCTATDSTIVTRSSDFPAVNPGSDLTYTCADTVFTLNATASGIGSLSFQWNASNGGCIDGPANVLRPRVSCPGTYSLRVTDQSNGCSANAVVNVRRNNFKPTITTASSAEINCSNLIQTLDASLSKSNSISNGALDFTWSSINGHFVSGTKGSVARVDSAGVYKLLLFDTSNSCFDSAEVRVTRDAAIPAANAGRDTTLTCVRKSLNLNGAGSSVSPSTVMYQWTTANGNIVRGASTLTPEINAAGTYVLSVLNPGNNCTIRDTVAISWDTVLPTPMISPVTQQITCTNNQLTLSGVSSSPQGNISFNWTTLDGRISFGTNAPSAVVESGGTYVLWVSNNSNGCLANTSVRVNQNLNKPPIFFTSPRLIDCVTASVTLTASLPDPDTVYNFSWGGPRILSGQNTSAPLVGQSGLYTLIMTNSITGCSNSGSVLVQENRITPTAKAAVSGALDCKKPTAQLLGAGSTTSGVTYNWRTNGIGQIVDSTKINATTNVSGWHYLTVRRTDNGCSSTDSVLVVSTVLPITGADLTPVNPDCRNPEGSIRINRVIGGTAPFLYSVNGGVSISQPLFNYLKTGLYQLRIEDINGCTWQDSVRLSLPSGVSVDLGDDIHINIGQKATLTAKVNLLPAQLEKVTWTSLPDTSKCKDCLIQEVTPKETTTYRITVTDKGGCVASDVVTVWVNKEVPFFVPTAFSPDGNGINDRLILHSGPVIEKVEIMRIFDRWGNMVFYAEDFPPNNPDYGWDGNFVGKPMNPGVFVWMVELVLPTGYREVYYGETTLVRK